MKPKVRLGTCWGLRIKKVPTECHRDGEEDVLFRSLGPEASRLYQTNLIASGGEFPTLITLNNNATARFDADHAGTNPAEGG